MSHEMLFMLIELGLSFVVGYSARALQTLTREGGKQ